MLDPLTSPVIVFLSDFSRLVLLALFWVFGFESRAVRNGPVLRRFGEFMVALAAVYTWFTLVYFDTRFNVFPWASLWLVALRWNWVAHTLLIVTLARLWLALRRT